MLSVRYPRWLSWNDAGLETESGRGMAEGMVWNVLVGRLILGIRWPRSS